MALTFALKAGGTSIYPFVLITSLKVCVDTFPNAIFELSNCEEDISIIVSFSFEVSISFSFFFDELQETVTPIINNIARLLNIYVFMFL